MQFVNTRTAFLANKKRLFGSRDGGRSWTGVVTAAAPIQSIDFLNTRIGWVAAGTELTRTTDGGRTWSMETTEQGLFDLRFVTPTTGYARGAPISTRDTMAASAPLLSTTDAGRMWTPVKRAAVVTSFCFTDASHGT